MKSCYGLIILFYVLQAYLVWKPEFFFAKLLKPELQSILVPSPVSIDLQRATDARHDRKRHG